VKTILPAVLLACSCAVAQSSQPDLASVDSEAKLQRDLRFRIAYEQQQRVARVAFLMLTGSAELCEGNTHYVSGMTLSNRQLFGEDSEAVSLLGLSDAVKVTSIVPGSPADRAGVQVDDVVVAINGSVISSGAGAVDAVLKKLEEVTKNGRSYAVTLRHDGVARDATVVPAKACAFSAVAIDGDVTNAFADSRNVTVTVGMLRFVEDDTELALVISHELAHNLMKHVQARSENQRAGVLERIGIIALAAAVARYNPGQAVQLIQTPVLTRESFSPEFEAEADYVGLYMMARAALPIDRAPEFWRRMGAAYPASSKAAFVSSQPGDPYRMLALEASVDEIRSKIDKGLPLVPEKGISLRFQHHVLQPEPAAPAPPLHTAYHVTFLLQHHSIANYAFGEPGDRAEDPLDFEDTVSKCLGQAMKRVAPSTVVISGREFRRTAFPDLDPPEAPHTVESLLVLAKNAEFQRRIAPLELDYIVVAKVSTGSIRAYTPSVLNTESRFSVSVIDANGQGLWQRQDVTAARASGPRLFNPIPFVNIESQACDQLGEHLAGSFARTAPAPPPVEGEVGQ